MTYELHFLGRVAAKKNNKIPLRNKEGKMRFRYGDQEGLDRLAVQVPGWARDMQLVHPDLEFQFTVQRRDFDRDNAVTTLLDLLVKMGCLKNDSVAQCNGKITILPAVISDHWATVVRLIEA